MEFGNSPHPKNSRKNPIREHANKIAGKHTNNNAYNIIIDGRDTHIPINLPVAVIGEKGSGKTTLIKSIIETTEHKIFNNIYFIYSPLTTDLTLPASVIRVDINECENFLMTLFESKTIYNSYIRFFKSLDFKKLQAKYEQGKLTLDDIYKYVDNNIIKYNKGVIYAIDSPNEKVDAIINTGEKIISKFSNPFYIGNYKINGFKFNDRDAVIIDDIAIASKILFKHIKDNPIYEYLTLTRHMRLFVLFAGQQIEQIPKSVRREVMCWLLSKSTNTELLKGVLSSSTINAIIREQQDIGKYEFVLYNMIDGDVSRI